MRIYSYVPPFTVILSRRLISKSRALPLFSIYYLLNILFKIQRYAILITTISISISYLPHNKTYLEKYHLFKYSISSIFFLLLHFQCLFCIIPTKIDQTTKKTKQSILDFKSLYFGGHINQYLSFKYYIESAHQKIVGF